MIGPVQDLIPVLEEMGHVEDAVDDGGVGKYGSGV